MPEIINLLLEHNEVNTDISSDVGNFGEKAAAGYLARHGFQLVMSNFKAPVGRNRKGVQVTGEIDLIALDDQTICFIEVKTRSSDEFAAPLSAVDVRKQRQITRTARIYRKIFGLHNSRFRYDVISIVLNGTKAPKVEHIKGFWTEQKFKKKLWLDDV